MADKRRKLLANQDTEQSHQRHHGGCWRAHVEKAINAPDQNANSKRYKIRLHRLTPR
jgi:hypothetical protein